MGMIFRLHRWDLLRKIIDTRHFREGFFASGVPGRSREIAVQFHPGPAQSRDQIPGNPR